MNPFHLIFDNPGVFEDYFLEEETKPLQNLLNLNMINIIIGANNSGKSRFIRLFMQSKYLKIDKLKLEEYNKVIKESLKIRYEIKILTLSNTIENQLRSNRLILNASRLSEGRRLGQELERISKNMIVENTFNKRYFIPTLRTAHSLFQNHQKIEDDIFEETLLNYYSVLKSSSIDIFTGLHLHKKILNARNSKREIRVNFENFEKFISKNFFDGKQVDIVAEFNKDESLEGKNISEIISIHIDGETETRKLYELGDGIQAIIILMYQIFMAEPNSFIYIDEPELNLHPGMQRLFLEQISSNEELKKKNLTYIITTHSNHFLDLTIEKENVSIYAFSPKSNSEGDKQFTIRNVNAGDNSVLKHLGVNNSSVFMANCSIWVEGISDRNYIKAFLKSYLKSIEGTKEYKSIKEDIDFAFFEYAGSNIGHYVFDEEIAKQEEELIKKEINSLALSNRIFLLADSDNADKRTTKGKRLSRLEVSKKDNFHPKIIWGVREIENLLPNEVWEKVLINFCNKKLVEAGRDEIQERIKKTIIPLHYSDYTKEYIGNFLNQVDVNLGKVDGTNILNKIYETKADGSFGTLIPKRELSELVLNADLDWSVYQENSEIEKLTKEIYDFIINKK
ncbi:ATP-binding protein [Flavobacterium sp. LaA7.5]|nr:ATP-binding protein [Flavobacterium salilacus subsp. altitudinum]